MKLRLCIFIESKIERDTFKEEKRLHLRSERMSFVWLPQCGYKGEKHLESLLEASTLRRNIIQLRFHIVPVKSTQGGGRSGTEIQQTE